MFSIDYPLAPKSKYPEIVESVAKAYLYIINLLNKVIRLKDYEIVFTGDSAGGNLCLALLNWILMNGMNPPKGLLLCYPVCNINMNQFTPSMLNCLHDYVLSFNMLNLCFKCYLSDSDDPDKDFMLRYFRFFKSAAMDYMNAIG